MNASWLDTNWLARRPRRRCQVGQTQTIELGRAAIRYQLAGTGSPVILIPDPPNTIEHYDGLTRMLMRDHRVLCFDPVGFGFSFPGPGFRFTISEQAELLLALLEAHQLRDCTLSVSCVGAFAGLLAASRRPDRIAKLILMQTASYAEMRTWTLQEDVCRIIQTPVVGQLATRIGKQLVARQWYGSALPAGADVSPYLEPTLASFQHGACFCLASAFQAFQRNRFALAAPIRQRTVLLWGGADRTHAKTRPESIREHVPHATLLHYADRGHFLDLENPSAYSELLRDIAGGR
ncbi:MAG: alpha/beta fold hydrolase [Gemmataceae bacterium]